MKFEEKVTPILAVVLAFSFFSLLALTTAIPKAEWMARMVREWS